MVDNNNKTEREYEYFKKNRYVTHQFKLEESLMERIFESCGYKFTIITLRNSEPHFIAKEVADGLGFSSPSNLVRNFRKYDLDTLTLTNENGLEEIRVRGLNPVPVDSLGRKWISWRRSW